MTTQLNVSEDARRTALLEAEGRLNKEIQTALGQFRQKISSDWHQESDHPELKSYDTFKQGPEKVFQFRESLLSLMFKIKDFKTLYNMMIASFVILTFTIVFSNYDEHGELLDHARLQSMFAGGHTVLLAWTVMVGLHFTVILVVKIGLAFPYKAVFLPLYLLHQGSIMGVAMWFSGDQKLGFSCVLMIMVEGTRMVMKSHSYFRTKMLYLTDNQYKNYQIKGWIATNEKRSKSPQEGKEILIEIKNNDFFTEFKYLSYFFVAPTIIYRDRYTLTPIRSMSKILVNGLNFLACIYYAFILYVFTCREIIEELGKELTTSRIILTVIKLMLPSTFFLILGFFGFLHSWLNCWAEITRFPDRCFYSDWWNSIEFGSYYRKWNIIVHDWLYYFVYIDTCRFINKPNLPMLVPKLITFLISAVIHELIVTYALGFFYPILFILFTGPGILLIQNQKNLKAISINFAFWLCMYIGSSLLFTFYLTESFARQRVPDEFIMQEWGSIGYFIPRTIYLGGPLSTPK